jgi:mannose-1-phosphate guanylyltransferase
MLEHALDFFKEEGIYQFIFAIGYLGEMIVKYFGDGSRMGVNIEYSTEENALGTGGAIKNLENQVTGRFIAANGDVLFRNLDIRDLLRFHAEKGGLATMVLWQASNTQRYGLVEATREGRIEEFIEKPRNPAPGWINAGLYVFEPEIFGYIPSHKKISLESDVFPELVQQNSLFGYRHTDYWADLGMPEDYAKVNRDYLTELVPSK